ncbi:multicopper oxidase domain-containing protein [Brevibacillus sp. SAFN-007a]|uniref:multicopper oxidase domain-containing protein n=1 Tax=Brevibacillus sp. SAFN-007a TaxID=3436862 RepID=UPI003F7F3921
MTDFEVLAGIHYGLFLILVLTALIPAIKANALVYQPTRSALAKKARATFFGVWPSVLVFAGQLLVSCLLFQSYGWLYIKDQTLGFFPLIAAPLLAVLCLSLPRLRQLATESDLIEADWRKAAAAPELIVPLQATVLGSLTACFLQLVYPAITLEPSILLLAWGVLVAVTSALWIMQSWKQQRCCCSEEWKPPAPLFRFLRAMAVLVILSAAIAFGGQQALLASRLPAQFKMAEHTNIDTGRSTALAAHAEHAAAPSAIRTVSVADLTGPREGKADRHFQLTAQKATVRLSSEKTLEAWTFNGQYPGPELRIRQGELVEVVLENKDIADGVTIHWHGLNVPNAEDGVAGVAFRADNPGLWMDHCHNQNHASLGMSMHLLYEGVTSPYEVGHATRNHPE